MGDGAGLKDKWGVKEGKPTPSDKQAREFRAAFDAQKTAITSSLAYTLQYSEEPKHSALAGRESGLYQAYNTAAGAIDPTDPSKAAGTIQKVLGDAAKLSQEAATLKTDTETAYEAWTQQFSFYERAETRVEELDSWDASTAAPFVALLATVRDHETARRWEKALADLLKLEQEMQPAYDDYVKQSAAKVPYDLGRPTFDSDFQSCTGHPRPSPEMATLKSDIETKIAAMDSAVEGKDYVTAHDTLKSATAVLTELTAAAKAHEKNEKAYNERLPQLEAGITAARERIGNLSDHGAGQMSPLLQALEAPKAPMISTAAGNDFEAALGHLEAMEASLAALESKLTEVEKSLDEIRRQIVDTQDALAKKESERAELDSLISELQLKLDVVLKDIERLEWEIKENFFKPKEAPLQDGSAVAELAYQARLAACVLDKNKLEAKLDSAKKRKAGLDERVRELKQEIVDLEKRKQKVLAGG